MLQDIWFKNKKEKKINKNRQETKIQKNGSLKYNHYIIAASTNIKSLVRNYYEQLYVNNINNLGKMDKFLERYKLPKLT